MGEITQKQRGKNQYKALCLIIFTFLMVNLIGISLISAWNFDNVKGDLIIDETTSRYGKIEIRNSLWVGFPLIELGVVSEIELLENSNICGSECYAEGKSTLYEPGLLIDSLTHNPKYDRIHSFKVYIKDKEKWKLYNNQILQEGTYYWRIEGKKKVRDSSDWWGTFNNVELTMWANWTGASSEGLMYYSKLDTNSGGLAIDETGRSQDGNFNNATNSGITWVDGNFGVGLRSNS